MQRVHFFRWARAARDTTRHADEHGAHGDFEPHESPKIMLLPLVVFFSLQRYFVRGLLAGSVKGG